MQDSCVKKYFKMKKIILKILKYFFYLLIFFLILLFSIPFVFKKQIINYLKDSINHNIKATVYVQSIYLNPIKFFPNITISIKNLTIIGIDDFKGDTLIYAPKVFVGFNFKKLLFHKKLIINDVELAKVYGNFKILQNGKANYDIVIKTENNKNQDNVNMQVHIKRLVLDDCIFKYADYQNNVIIYAQNINAFLKGNFSDSYSAIYTELSMHNAFLKVNKIELLKRTYLNFSGKFENNEKIKKYVIKNSKLKINNLSLFLNGSLQILNKGKIAIALSYITSQTEFKDLLSLIPSIYYHYFNGIQTQGSFTLNGYVKGTIDSINNNLIYNANLLVKNASLKFKGLKNKIRNINIALKFIGKGNLEEYIFKVSQFSAYSLSNKIEAFFIMRGAKNTLSAQGEANANIDFSTLKNFIPLKETVLTGLLQSSFKFNFPDLYSEDISDYLTAGNLTVKDFTATFSDGTFISIPKTNITFSTNKTLINNLHLKYVNSDFFVQGYLNNIFKYFLNSNEVLSGRLNIYSPFVDINQIIDYQENNQNVTYVDHNNEQDTLTFELPKQVRLILNIQSDSVKYENLLLTNIIGKVGLKNSVAYLQNINMNALNGRISLSGIYDASNYLYPKISFKYDMEHIVIAQISNITFIDSIAPILSKIQGVVNAGLTIDMLTDYQYNPIFRTLNGRGYLKSDNIAIENNKVFTLISKATGNPDFKNPSITNLDFRFSIVNGNIIVPETSFGFSDANIDVYGRSNLDRTIEFHILMQVKPQKVMKLISIPLTGFTNNIKVKIEIGGTIDEPKIVKIGTNITPSISIKKHELSSVGEAYMDSVRIKMQERLMVANRQRDSILNVAQTEAAIIREQARRQADSIMNIAQELIKPWKKKLNNPFLRKIAYKRMNKIMNRYRRRANKIIMKAEKRAKQIIKKAQREGDKIVKRVERQNDRIINKSRREALKM